MEYERPPLALMRRIQGERSSGQDIALDVYCSENALLREFFWFRLKLLTMLMGWFVRGRGGTVLDFGGGSGVFMPTLALGFESVSLIDLNTSQAEQLKAALQLDNVSIVTADIEAFDFEDGFDAVVAADVLEHFADLSVPLTRIHRWLDDDGHLYTSLPTENLAYRLLRILFRKTKPVDHYHSAREVEQALGGAGFRKVFGLCHPLLVPLFPLFRITVWRKVAPGDAARAG
jgi:2-polyprenyl-3-methyl-5-hydroxy-6-metoxy-1,4-benzoquinol methylase